MVGANYKFTYVDIGAAGRAGDAGVDGDSVLQQALKGNILSIPQGTTIMGIPTEISYHLIGGDAFHCHAK